MRFALSILEMLFLPQRQEEKGEEMQGIKLATKMHTLRGNRIKLIRIAKHGV